MKIIRFLLIMVFFISCSNFYGDEDLGNGYFLWKEGRYKKIVYNEDGTSGDGGYSVIKNNVINVKSNEHHIIVQTLDFEDSGQEVRKYWIIDKAVSINMDDCNNQESCDKTLKSNVTGPLDSLNFSKFIKKENIKLPF